MVLAGKRKNENTQSLPSSVPKAALPEKWRHPPPWCRNGRAAPVENGAGELAQRHGTPLSAAFPPGSDSKVCNGKSPVPKQIQPFPRGARRSPDEVQILLSESRLRALKQCDQALEPVANRRGFLSTIGIFARRSTTDIVPGSGAQPSSCSWPNCWVAIVCSGTSFAKPNAQIVDYAKNMLDRLSGGQLFLRLCPGEEADAARLELEAYNRTTGDGAINVAFLSGSQRFRVANAWCWGSANTRPRRICDLESVIIDEGFWLPGSQRPVGDDP